MKKSAKQNKIIRYRSAILLIMFSGLLIFLFVFLSTIAGTMRMERHTNNKIKNIENKAIRGEIISGDNFVLAYSQKQFRAEVHTRSIDPKKKDLFVKLFSIYSGMSEDDVLRKFVNKSGRSIKGRIKLCDNLDVRLASNLKSLSRKMGQLDIFRPLNPKKPHLVYGLDILADSETRHFPYQKILTPSLGYVQIKEHKNYKTPVGIKGLEKSYTAYLKPERNGLIRGKRDAIGTVLRDATVYTEKRQDGMNLHLNIVLSVQKEIEAILSKSKRKIAAQEIMAAVMDSRTGELLALATSERFNPEQIQQKDVKALNPNFSEYRYEPGSVMKPFVMAIALDQHKVKLNQSILLGGKHRVSKSFTIKDDEYFKSLYPKGIIMYSSNIGISKIAWNLTGKEFHDGLLGFGLGEPSGIDLSLDRGGKMRSASELNHKIFSATTAFGYGMNATFAQMMKAYSAFNNDGVAVTPKIVKYMSNKEGKIYDIERDVESLPATSPRTSRIINDMLLATVNRGTGTAAQYDGLEVGGKTGTAHIASKGKYTEEYHSSFYGFVNDRKGHKYTIGVFVIKPKKVYFASHTAAPAFHDIVEVLVKQNYLKIDRRLAKIHLKKRKAMRRRKRAAYVRKIQAYNKAHGIE